MAFCYRKFFIFMVLGLFFEKKSFFLKNVKFIFVILCKMGWLKIFWKICEFLPQKLRVFLDPFFCVLKTKKYKPPKTVLFKLFPSYLRNKKNITFFTFFFTADWPVFKNVKFLFKIFFFKNFKTKNLTIMPILRWFVKNF